jgi:hypothetical protein
MTVIDLDALTSADRLPRVRLFGRELVVRPLTGAAAHRLAVLQEKDDNPTALLGPLLDTLRSSLPELTDDERDALTVDQIAALLQLARGQVAEVETMLEEQAAQQTGAVPEGKAAAPPKTRG